METCRSGEERQQLCTEWRRVLRESRMHIIGADADAHVLRWLRVNAERIVAALESGDARVRGEEQ